MLYNYIEKKCAAKRVRSLLCRYRAQNKEWKERFLIEEWLRKIDRRFKRLGLNILMIVITAL